MPASLSPCQPACTGRKLGWQPRPRGCSAGARPPRTSAASGPLPPRVGGVWGPSPPAHRRHLGPLPPRVGGVWVPSLRPRAGTGRVRRQRGPGRLSAQVAVVLRVLCAVIWSRSPGARAACVPRAGGPHTRCGTRSVCCGVGPGPRACRPSTQSGLRRRRARALLRPIKFY